MILPVWKFFRRNPSFDLWEKIEKVKRGHREEAPKEPDLQPLVEMVGEVILHQPPTPLEAEKESQLRLRAEIEKDLFHRWSLDLSRRLRYLGVTAVLGWGLSALLLAFLTYQRGSYDATLKATLQALQEAKRQSMASRSIIIREEPPIEKGKNQASRESAPPTERKDRRKERESSSSSDWLTSFPLAGTNPVLTSTDNPDQAAMIQKANAALLAGKWDEAASLYAAAAEIDPNTDAALDALHSAAQVSASALKDERRAAEYYRREAMIARRLKARLQDDPNLREGTRQRIARAFTAAGLVEQNPQMLQEAIREIPGNNLIPSEEPTSSGQ